MATKAKSAAKAGQMLKITLTSGLVGKTESQRKVVRALGLGKQGSSKVHSDSLTIRGMVNKVSHLVTVAPASDQDKAKPLKPQGKRSAPPAAIEES